MYSFLSFGSAPGQDRHDAARGFRDEVDLHVDRHGAALVSAVRRSPPACPSIAAATAGETVTCSGAAGLPAASAAPACRVRRGRIRGGVFRPTFVLHRVVEHVLQAGAPIIGLTVTIAAAPASGLFAAPPRPPPRPPRPPPPPPAAAIITTILPRTSSALSALTVSPCVPSKIASPSPCGPRRPAP